MKKNSTSVLIFIIGLLPFVMVLGNSMLIPILPAMEEQLNITALEVGYLLAIFSIVAAIVIPFVGFLSDLYGRKVIVLISLTFVMIGSLVTIVAGKGVIEPFRWIVLGRVIQGIGAGGTAPLAMALVGDLFNGDERSKNLGILEVFNGVGKVISPFIGALAALFTWYSAFYVYFIVSFIAFVGVYFAIKPKTTYTANSSLSSYGKMFVHILRKKGRKLLPLAFISAVDLFILFGLLVFISFEIERIYAVDGIIKGIIFTIPLGALTIASYWTGKHIGDDQLFMKKLIVIGSATVLGTLIFFMFFSQFFSLIFGATIIAVGVGFTLPCVNTLITSSVGGKERGLVVSLYGMVRFLGVAFGPIFFALWMVEIVDMFVKAALLILFTFIWLMTALKINFKQLTRHLGNK